MLPASMGRSSFANGRRALAGMVFGSLLTLASAGGCAKIEAFDLVREGNALYKDAKFKDAIDKYDAAEEVWPNHVTLYWNRACAAESQVLRMKTPEEREERRKYADMALRDFQTWYDRLDVKTPESEKQILDHRLNILNADERCDDLLSYWFEKQRNDPKNENIYGAIIRQYEQCGDDAKVAEWYVKRTEDFPQSVKAWHALAIRRFDPLWPDPESGLAYNDQLPPAERLKVANGVLELLDKAVSLDPKFRDAYVWRSMAYTQRQYARVVIEEPELPEEKIEAILAREDLMLAWKQQKAVCDLDQLEDCPSDPAELRKLETACCPPPPLDAAAQAEDANLRAQIEAEMKAALEPPAEEESNKDKKKGKRKR